MTRYSKFLLVAVPAITLSMGAGAALAGKSFEDTGTIACVMDKWDETEKDKGHKVAQAANRCVLIPDDTAAPKVAEDCKGTYEYLPDGSWKAPGTCIDKYPGGDTVSLTWEEGSHMKEYTYKKTGGTGKYQGASGGGTYMYESLTDTLVGGRFKGTLVLP
jgi:hypothetical protein